MSEIQRYDPQLHYEHVFMEERADGDYVEYDDHARIIAEKDAACSRINIERAILRGWEDWASRPHNLKWLGRVDGTPIPNDIRVCILNSLMRHLRKEGND